MLCALCASPLAIWSRLRCRSRPRAASAVRFISPRPLPHSSCRNAACPGAASAVSWQGHVNGNVAGCGNELGSTCAENQVPLRTVVGPVTLCAQWHARHRVELPGAAAGRCTVEDPVGAAMAIALAQRSFLALLRACRSRFRSPRQLMTQRVAGNAADTLVGLADSENRLWSGTARQAPGPWPHSWFRNANCEQQSKSLATALQRIRTYNLAQTNPAPFRTRSFGLLRAGGRVCIKGSTNTLKREQACMRFRMHAISSSSFFDCVLLPNALQSPFHFTISTCRNAAADNRAS